MYTTTINVKLLLCDLTLVAALDTIPVCENTPHTLSVASSVEELNTADMILCDGVTVPLTGVRAACRDDAVVVLCSPRAKHAETDSGLVDIDLADEIWGVSVAYACKRFARILVQIFEKKELRRTRLYLNTLMDTSPDLIWIKDMRGAHLKVNEAFCHAVGKTKAQVEGRDHYYIWDIPQKEYEAGEYLWLETEEIVLARRERCVFDEKVKCRQGIRQFKTYKAPLKGEGDVLLGTVGVAQDVTRLALTQSELSESQNTFNVAIDTTHIHYWRYNPQNRCARIGRVYAREMGIAAEVDDYPETLIARGRIHPDSIEAVRDAHRQLQFGTETVSYDVHLIKLDGSDCWRRVKYTRLLEVADSDMPCLGISEEIDDYKRLEKNFSISAQQNDITTWVYDIENRCVYGIMNPPGGLNFTDQLLSNVPKILRRSKDVYKDDIPALIDLHKRIKGGEESASIVTRICARDGSSYHWYKISYTTVFSHTGKPLRAIGSARNITEQIKAEHLYAIQVAFRNNSTQHAVGTLLLNLTRNQVLEARGSYARYATSPSVDTMFEALMPHVSALEHPEAKIFYNRANLLEQFNTGQVTSRLDHIVFDFGKRFWVRASANLVCNPDTNEVEAFIHIVDIDAQKIVESCYSAAAARDHDSLAYIDLHSQKITLVFSHRHSLLGLSLNEPVDYHNYMDRVCETYVLDKERDKFHMSTRLHEVSAELLERTSFSRYVRTCDPNEGLRQKRVQFSWLDESRQLVCMTTSDITDAFKKEQRKNLLLQKALNAAKDSSHAKTDFLATMSHEIRTPMNTIIGMSEILLSRPLPPEIANNLNTIQTASAGLLSIINDILDFSKVESGKFNVHEVPYMSFSLFMDVSSIISVRLTEKPIHFLINVNPNIPASFVGDDLRIRQILLNILSNAVKYTEAGYIILTVDGTYQADGKFLLKMCVEDTGMGIRTTDIPHLFSQFTRMDVARTRHITGTGLGLALSRKLARLMHGDITVESRYGHGSTFTTILPQQVEHSEPTARMKAHGQNVLMYEPDARLSELLSHGLQQLGVGCMVCTVPGEIPLQSCVTHVVLRRKNLAEVKDLLSGLCSEGNVILLLGNDEFPDPEVMHHKQLPLPLFSLQMANVFNGETTLGTSRRSTGFDRSQIIPLPGVRVLIVDDNTTNLHVVKGLLAPYHMHIDTATSGRQALEMTRTGQYDLVFMDYMMPGMDGVETVSLLREREGYRETPIIALTANAVRGVRERLVEQGMTDFLAKPIEISKMDRLLKTYAAPLVPERCLLVETDSSPSLKRRVELPGTIEGMDMVSVASQIGNVDVYHDILKTYGNDMAARAQELSHFIELHDLPAFTIVVHAVKSASRSVGAFAVGDKAALLETQSMDGDLQAVTEACTSFLAELESLVERVKAYVALWVNTQEVEERLESNEFDPSVVARLKAACNAMDYDLAKRALQDLDAFWYPEECQELLNTMTTACADFDYEKLDACMSKV